MKIVKIINSLEQGGAEKLVVDLLNQMSENHEVYLITFKDDADSNNTFHLSELSPRVSYINLKFKKGLKFKDVITLYKTLNKIQPDVVHCHLYVVFHTAFYAFFNRKTKYLHTIHNDAEAECTAKNLKFVRRFLYRWNIFQAITISDKSKDSYNQFYKLENSILIYNGRKVPEKTTNFELVQSEIDSLKKDKNTKIFIHIGRFDDEQKNQSMLVSVFNRLIKEENNIILLIIGVGFDSNSATQLKAGAEKGIYFLGAKNNVADYLFISDAFCLSSRFEGMPITLIEALACGSVPVCTPVGGIKDIVKHGVNGFLSENTNEESYYRAVRQFITNPGTIKKEELEKYFRNNFTIEICASEHLKLYKKMVSES